MATSSLPQAVQLVLSPATFFGLRSHSFPSQWVKDNLARSTDANKSAVLTEMRAVISKAYQDQTLNTIDWPNYKLQRQAGPISGLFPRLILLIHSLATPSLTTFPSPLGKRKAWVFTWSHARLLTTGFHAN